ncbi:hypothetical protein [Micromonospora sp. L32]|uniref:hypothetical protein n=1 Tax=Micromonospora sp. L32 TaxID=3452214 RepID=UPI003F88C83C
MPASLDRIRKSMHVEPTKQNKGLTLTLVVTAYDNGMVMLDGIPINAAPDYDQAEGWLVTAEVAVSTINEFRRQVSKRQAELRGESPAG